MPDPISEFHKRKQSRKEHFEKYVYKWKEIPCSACNGSGRYDSNRHPKCGVCEGTGKDKVPFAQYQEYMKRGHVCSGYFDKRLDYPKENCGYCKGKS